MNTSLQHLLLKFKSVFPEAVTEIEKRGDDGKPYFVYALKEEFIDQLRDADLDIVGDQKRYELQFPGKGMAKAQAFVPSYKTLIADKEQSKNFDSTGNVFIEGDNLDVLRMLQNSYRSKIKVIYIDPPYNTGNDDFVYNDDFSIKQKEYLQAIGILDEDGERQMSELQTGLRGRFHAGWLAFMYPRLKLARELLTNDGVIFISIDDNEQANLKLLCDEIFGEENFYTSINWTARNKPMNAGSARFKFQTSEEFILAYGKIPMQLQGSFHLEISEQLEYPYQDKFGRRYREDNIQERKNIGVKRSAKMVYPILGINPTNNYRWTIGQNTAERLVKENLLSKREGSLIRIFYEDEENNERYHPLWSNFAESCGTSESGKAELDAITPGHGFETVKPTDLIKKILFHFTKEDSISLDFFAGSATTAHAVMQLNAEDGGKRKFIMVQWAENIDAKKSKEAFTFCTQTLNRPATIAEISKERIRRAGDKIIADNPDYPDIDTGFRVLRVCDSPISKDDQQPLARTTQDELSLRYHTSLTQEYFIPLLYEALLKTGVMLDVPLAIHQEAEYPFAICNRRCYCVTEKLTQAIVRKIAEAHGDAFDILYYLSDCPSPETSYTELESVFKLIPGDKKIKSLNFY